MCKKMDVVILTKSCKHGGYCVTGIDIHSGRWVRLVSSDEESHGALFDRHILYENGTLCNVLDVATVPVLRKAPIQYQPENILIAENVPWKYIKKLSIKDVLKIHPNEGYYYIFGNEDYCITEEQISTVGHSLELIKVYDVVITHQQNQEGKLKTKAGFRYMFHTYQKIAVTDPDFFHVPDQTYIAQAIIVMSLPSIPYHERRYYKFVAKIFTLDR